MGRFQDCDEAAHYEFLCKQARASVHYCAEQFTNDQTAQSSLLRAVQRTMAGEYSRQLSGRSYASQRRTASSGFRPGGPPGYSLRRVAVSADGTSRRQLLPGERPPFPTDRVSTFAEVGGTQAGAATPAPKSTAKQKTKRTTPQETNEPVPEPITVYARALACFSGAKFLCIRSTPMARLSSSEECFECLRALEYTPLCSPKV